jgi:rhomboid protease GluP
LSANVIMWLIMIGSGVSPILPTANDMNAWGGTNATHVVNGDYWRLFTSNYLHFGIIHLAVNMFSFNNLGRMLEQFIGWWRFGLIYTFAGIAGSAVSIWWNPYATGAGASGAILGVVGILLALLTTNLIEKTVRMKMLRSMAISAGLMILIGLQANVDNAAHLGGLAAGMLGGYFIFPELKAHYYEKKKQFLGCVAACILILGATGWFVMNAEKGPTIQELTAAFEHDQTIIESNYANGVYKTTDQLQENVVDFYALGIEVMQKNLDDSETPEAIVLYTRKRDYLIARKKYFEFVVRDTKKGTANSDSTVYWKNRSDTLFQIMNSR